MDKRARQIFRRCCAHAWANALLLLLLIGTSDVALAQSIAEFQNSWTYRALMLQQRQDLDAPLAAVTFVHTHNTYNSSAYAHELNYIDPNQSLSITDQLRLGVRSIEFDVHYTWAQQGAQWLQRLLLCHAKELHVGCLPTDLPVEVGLNELRAFLEQPQNQQEVVVLYVEDFISGHYAEAVQVVAEALGDKVYRPNPTPPLHLCTGIPMNLTKREILAAGKQVLIMGGASVCISTDSWNTWAFAGVGDFVLDNYPTVDIDDYALGICEVAWPRLLHDQYWLRVQEDRTWIAHLVGNGRAFTPSDVQLLVSCGVNLIGLDALKVADARYPALIWSWDVDQPPVPAAGCALQRATGRFTDADCSGHHRFACRGADAWHISSRVGTWSEGAEVCNDDAARFSLPVNGYDNARLTDVQREQQTEDVWINLSTHGSAVDWQSGF